MENQDQQPTSEDPNQQGVLSNSEEQGPSPPPPPTTATQAQTRLYECSFCKKGFSNAQALGGHMNIHRKDKAKLKQASKENQRLMDDQAKMNPLTPSSIAGCNSHNNNINKPLALEFPTGQQVIIRSTTSNSIPNTITNKRPPHTFPSRHQDQELSYESHVALAELKQLPLFVETASRVAVSSASTASDINNINHANPVNCQQHRAHAQANWQEDHPIHVSTQGTTLGAELDLELRLGHAPPKPTVVLGTRKFF